MYHHHHQQQQTQTDSTIRIFSPVILFHDATAECISDHQVIQLKKQKVNAMLKTNGQFWSNVIWSTRHQFSPPQTPPTSCSSNSSVISIEGQQKRWYHTPPEEDSDNSSLEEDEDDILEVVAVTNKKSKKTTTNTEVNRKRRGNLPKSVTAILRQWLVDHSKHPYPTEEEKRALKIKTNLTLNQISNWFINARRRILPLILASPDTLLIKEEEKKPCLSPATKRKRVDSEDRKLKK